MTETVGEYVVKVDGDVNELENAPELDADTNKASELTAVGPETHYVEFDTLSTSSGPIEVDGNESKPVHNGNAHGTTAAEAEARALKEAAATVEEAARLDYSESAANSNLFRPAHDVDDASAAAASQVNPSSAVPALYVTRPSPQQTPRARGRTHAPHPIHRGPSRHVSPRVSSSPTPRPNEARRSGSLNSARSVNTATSHLTDQILHRASIVSAARYHTSRRASSVVNRIGLHDYDNPSRRTALTEAEVFALERMAESEARRQSVLERAQQLSLARDALVSQNEMEREQELRRRLQARDAEREKIAKESSTERDDRLAAVRARRARQEKARQSLLAQQIHRESLVVTDPFSVWYVKHRFSTPQLRGQSPIAPGRSSAGETAANATTTPPRKHQLREERQKTAALLHPRTSAEVDNDQAARTRSCNGRSPRRWRSPSVQHERAWR